MPVSTDPRDYRVVLVDDHALFAESLELALGLASYDVRRVSPGDRSSLEGLTSLVLRHEPHLVLLDLDLGGLGDATDAIGPLARAGANVVVVTASHDRSRWGACIAQGARTVLPKSAGLRDTVAVVRKLHTGQRVLDVLERQQLLALWKRDHARHGRARQQFTRLSRREREVLGELMLGHNVHEIATSSHVSDQTVRTQVKAILAKLEVSSQLAAVGLAHEIGWHGGPEPRDGSGISR